MAKPQGFSGGLSIESVFCLTVAGVVPLYHIKFPFPYDVPFPILNFFFLFSSLSTTG